MSDNTREKTWHRRTPESVDEAANREGADGKEVFETGRAVQYILSSTGLARESTGLEHVSSARSDYAEHDRRSTPR